MNKEIGGEFAFSVSYFFKKRLNQLDRFIPDGTSLLTSSGRDSLSLIIKVLGLTSDDGVLLPSYLCPEILRPFREANIFVSFYRINKDLSIDLDDIARRVTKKTKALLIIHYFGYPQPIRQLRQLSQQHSLFLIEDMVQSFLTKDNGQPLGSVGDVAFTSFRKFLPVLDGSLALFKTEIVSVNSVKWANQSLTHLFYLCLRYLGMSSKNLYLKSLLVPKPLFLWLFEQADELLNRYPKPAKISSLSQSLLHKFDFNEIISRRRSNFQHLLDNWHFETVQPLLWSLPFGVCPLGFPVIAEDRDYFKRELIKRKVYPPIHWNLPLDISQEEFKTPWEISRHILTMPIDQRYEIRDMDYILRQIEKIESEV